MNPFNRFPAFIQDYLYRRGWSELRDVQNAACEVLFETNSHLLLAAGTASGKTEAAFLPILTLLSENPSQSISVLDISPIKALINDRFHRLSDLLQETHTEVFAWHGDIPSSRKGKLLKNPQGILQITPESLESLLINHYRDLPRLFSDLRFIVIDELHTFIDSERGGQIICQLARLSSVIKQVPRRIGLSATLGDKTLAQNWLQLGTNLEVIAPEIKSDSRRLRLAIEHFPSASLESYYRYIFEITKGTKSLIFANSRTEVESVITELRNIAKIEKSPDIYQVHHGSISAELRTDAERVIGEDYPSITAATLTLELGIDIGALERVIQLNAPFSVTSFLQRLGRSGRRGQVADLRFVCRELGGGESLGDRFPWQLLQSIAILQLYLEDRWLEPHQNRRYPYSLVFHQTLSILVSQGEMSPAQLAQIVLNLPICQYISQADFRQLLHHWLELEFMQQLENGNLILGLSGEKMVSNFRFYAVFEETVEYKVKSERGEIGSICSPPPLGDRLSLAGRTWEVLEIDRARKTVFVKPAQGSGQFSWRSHYQVTIHQQIIQKMRQILFEEQLYDYLLPTARSQLTAARKIARDFHLNREIIISETETIFYFFPWLGTKAFQTLGYILEMASLEAFQFKIVKFVSPYFLILKTHQNISAQELKSQIVKICKKIEVKDLTFSLNDSIKQQKYDEFIPKTFLLRSFIADYLDLEGLKVTMENR